MKSGIIRRIDDLGRICIPKGIRHEIGIKDYDYLEIYADKSKGVIILEKYKEMEDENDE